MIWTKLPKSDLRQIVERFAPNALEQLQEILPAIDGTARHALNPELATIARIAESFLPSDVFLHAEFRREVLQRMEIGFIAKVCSALNLDCLSDFNANVEGILAKGETLLVDALIRLDELSPRFQRQSSSLRAATVEIVPPSIAKPVLLSSYFRQLIDYQFHVYGECMHALEPDRGRTILQMPTGAGKTRTALEIACALLNARQETVVLWLAHSEELCDQAADSFESLFQHVATKRVTLVRNWGGLHRGALPQGNCFVVTTYQGLCQPSNSVRRLSANCVGLVICDEAHMAVAPKYRKAITGCIGTNTKVLGLTATPVRAADDETATLRQFFFNTIVSTSDKPEFDTKSLQAKGILSEPTFERIGTGIDLELTSPERNSAYSRGDIGVKQLTTLSKSAMRNAIIAKRCIALARENRSVLLFACSVAHSRFLASLLIACGVSAQHIDGDTDTALRRDAIEAYRRGDTKVLCNFGILATGFDAPNTYAVVLARPTFSPVLYSQMVGRAMRGPRMGGLQRTLVIDIQDNFQVHGKPLDLFEKFRAQWTSQG